MKLNALSKSYLILFLHALIGILIIGVVQTLSPPPWLNKSVIILLLFIVTNIVTTLSFNLKGEIRTYWSLKRSYYLPIGILFGELIAFFPLLIGLIIGKATLNGLTFSSSFTLSSIIATFVVVCWEELWFRGIFLNQCNKHLSTIKLSIVMGALFMLVHLMNPEINLLKTGPNLFFAGALLTIVYFFFKTIWLPIGLHFGNNYLTVESNLYSHWILGNEGYLGAFILALAFLSLAWLTLNKSSRTK